MQKVSSRPTPNYFHSVVANSLHDKIAHERPTKSLILLTPFDTLGKKSKKNKSSRVSSLEVEAKPLVYGGCPG